MAALSVSSWMSYAYSRFIRTYLRVFLFVFLIINITFQFAHPYLPACRTSSVLNMQSMFYSKFLHNYPHAQDDYIRLRILEQRHTIGKMAAIFLNCLTLDPLTSVAFVPLSSQSAKPFLCCQYICLYQWKECSVLRKRMSWHSTLSTDITVEPLDYFISLFFFLFI